MIPRFKPYLGKQEFFALFHSRKGAVCQFEKEFAQTFQAADAVVFPYGRSALWAFLKALNIKNSQVVMPAYTCSVVAHAISLSGNQPAFVDIRLSDYNMDLDLLPKIINRNTKGVIATHLFGYPLNIDLVEEIVSEAESRFGHKIWLIQDCAHSFGAEWEGRIVGSSGDVAIYASNISKMITSIFGGILTFQDQGLATKIRKYRDLKFQKPAPLKSWLRRLYLLAVFGAFNENIYGLTWLMQEKTTILNKLTKAYHLDERICFPPDYLDKMLEVEAAVGIEQLKKYSIIIKNRREGAKWYNENLPRKKGWIFPPIVEGATYSHYVVRVPNREAVLKEYAGLNIHLGELIQYSVPSLPGYKRLGYLCPKSEIASKATINFPFCNLSKLKKRL